MTKTADAEQLPELREQAKQTVDRFVRRFDESYRLLAYHAALPLVLTPELVNYLRNEFLRGDRVPWVAEVDLLLSDLCSQVGYELYAMDTHVRAYLLEQMKERYGEQRMREVAQVLISYVSYLSRLNPGRRQQEIEAQRWAAMVYLGDKQCKAAAQEIAKRLLETSSGTGSASHTDSGIRAELARLTRITDELSPQLKEEPSLLQYARLVQRVLRTPETVNPVELSGSYQVEDVELRFPERLLPATLAKTVAASRQKVTQLKGFPPIQIFTVEVATISFQEKTPSGTKLQPFQFKTVFVNKKGDIVREEKRQASFYEEPLAEGVEPLKMIAIPAGEFQMGSPEDEKDRYDDERPQHKVKVPQFFMSQTPITQAQWRAIANLPQIQRELKPNPSNFEGDDRPVEQVSWYDAIEFCARLSRYTRRAYRLPSEAEWEYACRAGTTAPFHFGETLTTDLANYGGSTYQEESEGEYREQTTPVRQFSPNAFGLYDMHGQVWEWCADPWHGSYEEAPTDGRVWDEENNNDNYYQNVLGNLEASLKDERNRVYRGGSWSYFPCNCRSACRFNDVPDFDDDDLGFRVVCGVPRTS